jgi:hypothetical protein
MAKELNLIEIPPPLGLEWKGIFFYMFVIDNSIAML